MKILQMGDPMLSTISEPVTNFNESLRRLAKQMIVECKKVANCGGLAAVQVGKPIRMSVIKKANRWIAIVNPEVLNSSVKTNVDWEGCMSIGEGDEQLFSKIKRSAILTVRYFDEFGIEKVTTLKGYNAHVFQHEIDHMNGILFLKHVKDPDSIWTSKQLDDFIEKNEALP